MESSYMDSISLLLYNNYLPVWLPIVRRSIEQELQISKSSNPTNTYTRQLHVTRNYNVYKSPRNPFRQFIVTNLSQPPNIRERRRTRKIFSTVAYCYERKNKNEVQRSVSIDKQKLFLTPR